MKSQIHYRFKLKIRFLIHSLILFSSFFSFYAQSQINEDTLGKAYTDEIIIKGTAHKEKEIVYENSKYYILDYNINDEGTFLLVNNLRKYYVYSMDSNMNVESQILLSFHPKSLFEDCLGHVHIMSEDSMYQVVKLQNDLVIYDRTSIALYYTFYRRCIAHNDIGLVFKAYSNLNQSLVYSQTNNVTHQVKTIYSVEDSTLIRSVRDTRNRIAGMAGGNVMGEVSIDQMKEIRKKEQDINFFNQIVTKPDYHPLFVLNDTTYIFDHLNEKVVLFSDTISKLASYPVSYQKSKNWKKEMYLDKESHNFYAINQVNGIYIFELLDLPSSKINKETAVSKQIFPRKVSVHNGYVYYLYKEDMEANLNKLYRYKL